MRRRTFLTALGVATTASSVTSATAAAETTLQTTASTVDPLELDSSASLLDSGGGYLTDDSRIAVRAEDTALNRDADGNEDAVYYDSETPIPVVAVDGSVVGFGATLVSDEANFRNGNEEFLLNVWDAHLGGSGTVLYDEGHDQYHSLSDFSNMANYAGENGYAVEATTTIADDLGNADAAWITAPSTAFSDAETAALADFVADGGVLFCHDRADYSDYDETANFNALASDLDLAFRFNDDQVTDDENNGGAYYKPTTTQFNTAFDYFGDRPGMEIDPDATHTVDVIQVTDGDTVDVRFDSGREENVRILGMDTPEKEQYQQYERVQEWVGIEDLDYLATWGDNATTYAQDRLADERVDISFDEAESGIFDRYDRLLAYIRYDGTGDGSRDAFYNREAVADGYSRLYSSAFTNHESFYEAEQAARADGRGVWGESDPENSSEFRNRAVEEVFVPSASTVRTRDGAVADDRVPVYAADSATQTPDTGYDYSGDLPLVGVDETGGVAVVGGLPIDESYEADEGFTVDTSGYENFTLTTNLIDYLSSASGDVLVDGGHGQFQADYALGEEDAAYYLRHLEGFGIEFEQVNGNYGERLAGARAIIVTPPAEPFTDAEADALAAHLDDGGAVVLLGGADATDDARGNLNDLAAALGTDLRLNDDSVTDGTNNVDDDETIPTTTAFDGSFPLFSAYPSVGSDGDLSVAGVSPEGDTLNDEFVVFENAGDGDLDLTGWTVEDEAGYSYQFPDGYVLTPGAQVRLRTGSGGDTSTDLYWGSGSYVWNDGGDTVYAYDADGALAAEYTYPQSSGDGAIEVASVHPDAEGDDRNNLNDEYVVLENAGDADLDLTGYTVEDEVSTCTGSPTASRSRPATR